MEEKLDSIRRRNEEHQATPQNKHDWLSASLPELRRAYSEMTSLEQVRTIVDAAEIGVIPISFD